MQTRAAAVRCSLASASSSESGLERWLCVARSTSHGNADVIRLSYSAPVRTPLQDTIERLHARFAAVNAGEVATYIPELGRANPAHFGVACVTVDGHVYTAGDADVEFTIQSISKPIVYGLALDDFGLETVAQKVGVEPSGEAFNAISLDPATGRPRNPMINAGAIATASLVKGETTDEKMQRTVDRMSAFAGRRLDVDDRVHCSERDTGHRNRAIAYLLRNADIVGADVDAVLDRYFRQCSVLVTAQDLAVMAATLANGGLNPMSRERVGAFDHVQHVLSVMSTCGMYDYAGSWLYRVGMPAKSGVSGGVLAVLPGQLGIGVFSPLLDGFGNSVRGVALCEALSEEFGLHLLRPPIQPESVVLRSHTLAQAGSKHRRTDAELAEIARSGDQVRVHRLQGPLAFSTAEVALRHATDEFAPGRTFIFECARVGAVDRAAMRLFQGFCNVVFAAGGNVIFAGLRETDEWQMSAVIEGGRTPMFFDTIDSVLEWCENQLLGDMSLASGRAIDVDDHPMLAALTSEERSMLAAVLQRVEFEPRDVVVRQGDEADAIFLVVAGRASVHVNLPGERRYRLATMTSGAVFGEVALMDNQPRTADVEADENLVCYVLRLDSLAEVDAVAPVVRTKLVQQLARDLASRLRRADSEIMMLAS